MKYVEQVVMALLHSNAHKATKYVSKNEVVRATRTLLRGKVPTRGNVDIRLTIGRPNYAERKFIKVCEKAQCSFPLKKTVLKFPPKSKGARR